MAKPSITNIRPTSSGTPAKTTWTLDTLSDQDAFYGDSANGRYDALLAQLSPSAKSVAQGGTYSYIFLGINGGADETIVGRQSLAGIIVSGNGKDNITGGALSDLVFSGNGVDVVHGGAGDDRIYGENGGDRLYGDGGSDAIFGGNGDDLIVGGADGGIAGWHLHHVDAVYELRDVTTTTTELRTDIAWAAQLPADGTAVTGTGALNKEALQQRGTFLDANGDIRQIFAYNLPDLPSVGTNEPHAFTVAVFESGFGDYVGTVGRYTALEDKDVYFSVNVGHLDAATAYSGGGKVLVFLGNLTDAQLQAKSGNQQAQQASTKDIALAGLDSYYHTETVTTQEQVLVTPEINEWRWSWTSAGDVLDGGPDADAFVYSRGDGVDVINGFNRAEGDVLKLVGFTAGDVEVGADDAGNSIVKFLDRDYNGAIRIAGIADFAASEIVFA